MKFFPDSGRVKNIILQYFFFNIKHTSKPWSYAENLPLLSLASTFIVQLVLNMTLFQTLVEEGFDFVSNLII